MSLLAVVVVAYALWASLLFLVQRQMLFPGAVLPPLPGVRETLPGLRELRLPVPGGEVDAWFLPPPGAGPAPALLFAHGNGELIDHAAHDLLSFVRRGYGVMLVEYPGYGRSTGRPSYGSVMAAAFAAYDALAAQPEVDPARIVGYGRSLGAAPVAILAGERPVAALVLQSAFTSPRAFARRFLVPGFLVRDRFEVLDALRARDGPVLLFHGRRDDVIPYSHGVALSEVLPPGSRFVTWECAHNDCPPAWEPHVDEVVEFLAERGIAP